MSANMRRILVGVTVLVLCAPAIAAAADFAPVDAPGPALSVSEAELAKALGCSEGGVAGARVTPVLLVQGTGATAKDNWSWTYEPALTQLGIPWCHVDLPGQATGDVQRAGEYVVAAVRFMHRAAGRRVAVIGHSQGGMVPRWALRWWPDVRRMVDDVIGFAPSNHGTTQASCSTGEPCSPAGWQQMDEANFIKALNSRAETFGGVSYTNIVTRRDETVLPIESSFLSAAAGGGRVTNVATQDICPADPYEHLLIGLVDPVAYALAIDALTHDGPADVSRVDPLVCAQVFHPGINPVTAPIDGAAAAASFASYQAATVPAEPPLACYTTASCPLGGMPGGGIKPARLVETGCSRRRIFTVTFKLRRRGARATLAGKRVKVRARRGGRVAVRIDLRGRGRRVVKLRLRGRDRRGRNVTVVRLYHAC